MYCIARDGKLVGASVYLGRIKAYHSDTFSSVPYFTPLDEFVLGTLPVPDLDGSVSTVHIGPYTVEAIESHKRGAGEASLSNFPYNYHVNDKPSSLSIWRHVNVCLNAMR